MTQWEWSSKQKLGTCFTKSISDYPRPSQGGLGPNLGVLSREWDLQMLVVGFLLLLFFVFVCFFVFWFFFWFFETGFPCVIVLAVLELALVDQADSSQGFICLYLLSAGIKGVRHHLPAMLGIY